MTSRKYLFIMIALLSLALLLVACGGAAAQQAPAQEAAPAEQEAAQAEEAPVEAEAEEPPSRGAAGGEVQYAVGDILVYDADPWSKIKVISSDESGIGFEFCNDPDCASSGGGGKLDLAFDGDAILSVDEARTSSRIPDDLKQALNLLPEEAAAAEDTSAQEAEAASEETSSGDEAATEEETTSSDQVATESTDAGSDEAVTDETDEQAAIEITETGNNEAVAPVEGNGSAGCDQAAFQAEINSLLAEHERARQEATGIDGKNRLSKLTWSKELACQAEEWAKQIVAGTYQTNSHYNARAVPHSEPNTWTHLWTGENISYGYSAMSAKSAVDSWESEEQGFDHQTGACSIDECGHYETMIASYQQEVGCGMAMVPSAQPNAYEEATTVWVCQYKGTYPFTVDTQVVIAGEGGEWFAAKITKLEGISLVVEWIDENGNLLNQGGVKVGGANLTEDTIRLLDDAKKQGLNIVY